MSRDPVLNFGSYRLDVGDEQLWRDEQPVRLTPKAFQVLRTLMDNSGQLVTKEELFRVIWADTVVSDAALTSCIQELRQALEDNARNPQYIETVHRRGFRFIAPIAAAAAPVPSSKLQEEESQKPVLSSAEGANGKRQVAKVENGLGSSVQSAESEEHQQVVNGQTLDLGLSDARLSDSNLQTLDTAVSSTSSRLIRNVVLAAVLLIITIVLTVQYLSRPIPGTQDSALRTEAIPVAWPLPDKPSIIILPFINMSGDHAQEYFSDGITEAITASLSGVSSLFVIARTSAFTYKDKAAKVQDIGREMGVRYVLEGSVQRADERVRITVQLIDAATGGHVWSSHYDRELRDIFALQDEIGQRIVTALKVNLTPEEQARFRRAPTTNLEAYDDFLRGWEFYWQETKEANAQARRLFEQALALDPQYAGAYAGLSSTHLRDWLLQWSPDRQSLEHAFDAAQKALALDDTLPLAYIVLAPVYQKKNQHEQAIAAAERAIALNPNDATAYLVLADQLGMAGRPEEGITMAKTAMRLNPHYPPWYLLQLGSNYHQAWWNEEAITALKRFLVYYPNALNTHIMLTCSYSDAGRMEEARAEAAEVMRLSPNFSIEVWRQNQFWKDPKEMERHLNNLRKAGLQ
jgi:adenylate cyclase